MTDIDDSEMPYQNFYRLLVWWSVALLASIGCVAASAQDDDFGILLYLPAIIADTKGGGAQTTTGSTSTPAGATSQVDLCRGYRVNDMANYPMRSLAKPQPGRAYVDPSFGSRVVRITNADAISSGIIKTMYNTIQAWNADESRMILWHRGDGHHLYNGSSYQRIGRLPISPADLEQVFWSSTNPNILYYVNSASGQQVTTSGGAITLRGDELMQYNVSTQRHRLIKPLNSYCPNGSLTAGTDVQMTARGDDVFGLRCGDTGFTYTVSSDALTTMPGSASGFAPQPFPSGRYSYHRGRILGRGLSVVRTLGLGNVSEHSSLGTMHDGSDGYFATAFDADPSGRCGTGIGSLVVHSASTGACRVLVGPSNGYPYTPSGTHPSALSFKNPGWVAVSSIGYATRGDTVLEQELYLANTDPAAPTVCRIAHHRATGRKGSIGYFAEPHPVLSPTGTRILFSSDWSDSGTVDVYVVETPSYSER